jgi:(hydroxyamino)benzene mutase
VQHLLLILGLTLFLLGLLTGLTIPVLHNPRMGVASHLQGVSNGTFLALTGLLWPQLHLWQAGRLAVVVLLVYGAYANWLATQLGAIWGAGRRFARLASGAHCGTPVQERIVDLLLATLAPAMVAGTVLLIIGLLR